MVAGGKDCLNLTFADVIPDNPLGICCCGCCTIVNLILIILFFPCTVTQLGQFKYGLVKNTITGIVDLDQVFYPGRYWIGFWKTFIEFPSTLNTIEFSDESPEKGVKQLSVLSARDRDGKQLYLDISVQYRLRPEQLGKIYKDMTILYEDVYISDLRDKLAKAAQKFGGAQFWENFAEVQAEMFESCQVHLQDRHAICWGLQLWGVKVNKDWEDRLILTQVKTQQAKTAVWDKAAGLYRAETKKNLAQYTKDIIIERSRGESLVYRIERQAVALAEARRVEAGAKVLKIIKDTVRFKSGNCTDAEETTALSGSRA